MRKILSLKQLLKSHHLAIVLAVVVGFICLAPHLIFPFQVGKDYRGLPMLATDDEDIYLARLQEITDGHPWLGSVWFYEYKNEPSLVAPTSDFIQYGLARLLSLSLIGSLLLVKFLFPAILFFLIYAFVYKILDENTNQAKWSGCAAALFITLGYDLTDKTQILDLLSGQFQASTFLIWTRPINPILGSLIIFSLLITVWSLYKKVTFSKVIIASLLLTLGVASYFFTGALAASFIGMLLITALLRRHWDRARSLGAVIILSLLFASPYLYSVLSASRNPLFTEAALRLGLTQSHQPVFNLIIMLTTLLFCLVTIREFKSRQSDWWWFCLALLLSCLAVFNQQVITGKTIWYPHFVQYTIPLSIVILIILLHKKLKPLNHRIWLALIVFIALATSSVGVLKQVSAYQTNFATYKDRQSIMPVFNWFNSQTDKDSVIYVLEDEEIIMRLIPAFTHNNVYSGSNLSSLVPPERIYHDYLIAMKLKGISPELASDYLAEHDAQIRWYFGGMNDWKQLTTSQRYLDNRYSLLQAYPDFLQNDLTTQLKQHRLDYFLHQGPLNGELLSHLPSLSLLKNINGYYIYKFD